MILKDPSQADTLVGQNGIDSMDDHQSGESQNQHPHLTTMSPIKLKRRVNSQDTCTYLQFTFSGVDLDL